MKIIQLQWGCTPAVQDDMTTSSMGEPEMGHHLILCCCLAIGTEEDTDSQGIEDGYAADAAAAAGDGQFF